MLGLPPDPPLGHSGAVDSGSHARNIEPTGPVTASDLALRLLKKAGWTGGALGKNEDGPLNPLTVKLKLNRKGIGM